MIESTHLTTALSLGVLAYFVWTEHRRGALAPVVPLALTLVVAAWLAENTCIHLYGFYQYTSSWPGMLDRVPLMVALIWPFVILSDRKVVAALVGEGHPHLPLLTGALVVWDACLMEAVAVKAGLWSWNEEGLFHVPVIGILGWGLFTWSALAWWEGLRRRWPTSGEVGRCAATVLLAGLSTHALLLALWWGALRWVLREPLPGWGLAVVNAVVGLVMAAALVRSGARVGMDVLAPRIPAALVFFALLLLYGLDEPALVAFAVSFAPPWVALTARSARGAPR